MHINKMIIIKVATDAIAIIITTFLSSSGGFRLNGLSESLLVAVVEDAKTLSNAIVEGAEPLLVVIVENREPFLGGIVEGRESLLIAIIVATAVVLVLVVFLVVILTDVLGVCVVDANGATGS